MKIAVIGSRNITLDHIEDYIPKQATVLISGGATGVDSCVRSYALKMGITFIEILPDYARYKRGAPLKRNEQIISQADEVVALWDGKSHGTQFCIRLCQKIGKKITVHLLPTQA